MLYSIVCLTYKRPELLEESVYSVLQQTCKDWELLIINDYNFQIIHFNHPQVRIYNIKEKFKTIADKRNFGVKNALGRLILQLDDDDFLLPFYLENLKIAIGDDEWLMVQRPILYYNDFQKIHLSPIPQTNTFLYGRNTVGKEFQYESNITDEGITLNSFYERTMRNFKGKHRMMQLKPDQCGYVWRQDIDDKRKYSLANFLNEKITTDNQNKVLKSIESETGDIFLSPKWNKDYTSIIKNNIKIIPFNSVYNKSKGGRELIKAVQNSIDVFKKENGNGSENILQTPIKNNIPDDSWTIVKPTWENAVKFINAVKSRGVVSTTLDVIGIDKTSGERVSEDIYQQRKLSCFGDINKNIEACYRLKHIQNRGYFCGGCGCGDKNLARLDADTPNEYTKLHYPKLECPLKKKGFSNFEFSGYIKVLNKTPLSIIIPVLNDNEELNLTIQSIRETSPSNVEIIVIDDKSDIPVILNDKSVKLTRLDTRMGVGATRHLGATLATSDYLLFIDSHMRFETNWYNNVIKRLITNPSNIVWCATCLGLTENNMDINKFDGDYYGARLVLYDEKENQVFEGKWISEKEGNDYEISCLMGACYFFHKSWFLYIGGTKSLKMWGSDEPLLSAKTYLAGGSIKIMKDVKIGHKFRPAAPYSTNVSYLIYNKLRSIKMLFSDDFYKKLELKIENNGDKIEALNMMYRDRKEIEEEKQYYKTIFTRDEKWLCNKFDIKYEI